MFCGAHLKRKGEGYLVKEGKRKHMGEVKIGDGVLQAGFKEEWAGEVPQDARVGKRVVKRECSSIKGTEKTKV